MNHHGIERKDRILLSVPVSWQREGKKEQQLRRRKEKERSYGRSRPLWWKASARQLDRRQDTVWKRGRGGKKQPEKKGADQAASIEELLDIVPRPSTPRPTSGVKEEEERAFLGQREASRTASLPARFTA